MNIQVKTPNADKHFLHIKKLTQDYFTFIQGTDIQDMLDFTDLDIKEFSDQWNSLELDQYMGDGGRYRYRQPKATVELTNPFDLVIADDARTLHDVSPIEASDNDALGTRDVLVIAFTKLEQTH